MTILDPGPQPDPGPVPALAEVDGHLLRVERAWPDTTVDADGTRRVTVEATDQHGRVRAARLHLGPATTSGTTNPGSFELRRTQLCPPGEDRKLPALAAAAARGPVVAHRFGKRAVVRGTHSFLKVVRPGQGPQVAARAEDGRRYAQAAGLAAPAVLTHTGDLVEFDVLPGQTLHELGGTADPARWQAWWHLWAGAWPVLTAADPGGLPRHDAHREADTLLQWANRAQAFATLPAGTLGPYLVQVDAVVDRLRAGPAQPLVMAHRDLHDKQFLAHEAGLGLLDFDTASRAEPALDLANLLVHIRLRQDQGLWPAGHGRAAEAAVRSVVAHLQVPDERLDVYAESTRLRLAALYSFRPRYRTLAARWATGA